MFDPYHKWLGIPPKDQPPHHYRLLSLDLFESDPEVIDAAANRQMAYVQQRPKILPVPTLGMVLGNLDHMDVARGVAAVGFPRTPFLASPKPRSG
jgi:hypothetical protein